MAGQTRKDDMAKARVDGGATSVSGVPTDLDEPVTVRKMIEVFRAMGVVPSSLDAGVVEGPVWPDLANTVANSATIRNSYGRKAAVWATGVDYVVGELVLSGSTLYRCITAHTSSGSFDSSKFTAASAGKTWPGSTNTGSNLTSLSLATDSTTSGVTTLNATYTNKIFTNYIRVQNNGVTFKNCKFLNGFYVESNRTGCVVQNCEIDGAGTQYFVVRMDAGSGLTIVDSTVKNGIDVGIMCVTSTASLIAERCNVYGAADGIKIGTNSVIRESWIHDLTIGPSSHNDGIANDNLASGWEIVGNTIDINAPQTSCAFLGDSGTGVSGLFEGNLVRGGGYCIYGGIASGTGIKVIGNTFDVTYYATAGFYGPVAYWYPAGNTWYGNVWSTGEITRPI